MVEWKSKSLLRLETQRSYRIQYRGALRWIYAEKNAYACRYQYSRQPRPTA